MTHKSKSTPRLTASRQWALYLATRAPDAPVGEILRGYGLHLDELREIEQTIESAALAALKVRGRHGRQPRDVSPERTLQLEQELSEKTRALAELSVASLWSLEPARKGRKMRRFCTQNRGFSCVFGGF